MSPSPFTSNERKISKARPLTEGTNDPDSVVNLVGCIGGSLDISVMSSKANLTQNVYRQHPDGEIALIKSTNELLLRNGDDTHSFGTLSMDVLQGPKGEPGADGKQGERESRF